MWDHANYNLTPAFRDTGVADAAYKGTLYEWLRGETGQPAGTSGSLWNPLPAGSTENQLMFSYHVDTNMAGGQVEFNLPTGWKILTTATNVFGIEADGTTVQPLLNDSITGDADAYGRYGTSLLIEIREDFDGSTVGDPSTVTIYRLRKDGKTVDGDCNNTHCLRWY